ADRTPRGQSGVLRLPDDPPDLAAHPGRGSPLRARGRHDQHLHARGQPGAGALRHRDVSDQPGTRVLRPAGPAGRVRPRGLPRPEAEARRVKGAARLQALLDEGVAAGVFPCAAAVVLRGGRRVFEGAVGGATLRTVFDLASLTKILGTTAA